MNKHFKHCAYNVTSGEIIETNNGNYLKRIVKQRQKNDIKTYNFYSSKWIFANGENAFEKVCEKAKKYNVDGNRITF